MKFIRIILVAIAICAVTNGFSQQIEQAVMQQVSPLTPNAASLGKYGDIPVSLYTGVPNISIPLYQINVGGFTLPISLSYHAGGVQVDDIPSWVGTGWSLNAGGVLNCRMRGISDYEMLNRKSSFASEIATILNPSAPKADKDAAGFTLEEFGYDTEADIFSISTGTLSHKFFLDLNGNAHGLPERKLQIRTEGAVSLNQGNDEYFARWLVKDENGIEYIFGRTVDSQKEEYEITRIELICGANSGDQEVVSSWYLNEIKLPWGESIYFTYEYFSFCRGNISGQVFSGSNGAQSWTSSTNYLKSLRIKEITFPTGKVEFVPGDLRRDINNDKVLDRIKIYSKRSGNYVEEKSFHLVTNNPAGNTITDDETFRLTLLSVTEYDKDGTPLSPYVFKYNHEASEAYTLGLPARLSYAQDLWGYYNGKTTNQSLVPSQYGLLGDVTERWGSTTGADRAVYPEYAQKGILTKITYPTRGTTQFFYESNTAKGITQEDPNLTWGNWEITPKPFINPGWELADMSAIASGPSPGAHIQLENVDGNDIAYDPFEIGGELSTNVTVGLNILYANSNECTIFDHGGATGKEMNCVQITIEKKDVNGSYGLFMPTVYFGRSYQIAPGEYRLKVQWKNPEQDAEGEPTMKYSIARVDLSWNEPIIPNPGGPFVVGGLRIAKIVDTDGNTGRDVVRWFDYDYNETVSGVPPYSGTSGIIQKTCLRFYNSGSWVIVPSNFGLQTSGGDHVGYRKVAIIYGADKNGGKQVTYFTSAVEYPDGNMAISKQLASGYEATEVPWRRGLVDRVVDLKYENNNYGVVRETENKYTFLKQPNDANNYQYVNIRGTSTFKTVSEAFYMHESTERQKYSSGELVTTSTFEQNPLNLATSKTTTSTSEGDQEHVVTKYPVDYDNVENISALKTGNFISKPIKTETFKNDKLLNGIVIKYTDAGQPKEVYRYENNNLIAVPPHNGNTIVPTNYVLRSQFSYSALSNKLEESKQPDNYSTAYIWGYDRALPVIKIENMSSGQIPSSLISNIEGHVFTGSTQVSDFQVDVNFLNDQVNALRSDSRYRVTTYTYNTAFGMTSQTDINGETIYYEYDAFGRLETIKDSDQNIIKRYKYHYQNEQ